ncbi:hypothetical protein NBE98_11865 [Clostridium swellfunianum]|uniref:hypothetical protein n=1 Tax=Clostridium swellfunianum TaxID=1367462 RepID=UPI00202EC338|nr:hypothetical protein [Clostridium swellfunianum]MCM0649071.1 hypothetical protein [Clostridium swellfunianum]
MGFTNSVSPGELTILANAVALILSSDRTADEVNVLGNFITAVGALMLVIAAQQASLESIQNNQQQAQSSNKQSVKSR